jgi:hypothetical protein
MIDVLLKCKCTDGEMTLTVREREDDEDIRDYMEYIQRTIGAWHSVRQCDEVALEYLKIPIADRPDAKIG